MIDHAVGIFEDAKKGKGVCAADDYNRAIKAIKHAKIDTTNDYILQKYNLCILNELCPNPSKAVFEKALADLNSVLIRRHEFSDSLLGLYDKVAALNFRSHKYNEAITFINCALAIEKRHKKSDSDYTDEELHEQFKRRWRLALCLEYSGLNAIQEHQKGSRGIPFIEKAIRLLVGSKILSSVVEKTTDNCNNQIENSIDLISLQKSNHPLFLLASPEEEVVTVSGTEFSEPCLARTLEKWNKSEHFKDGDSPELFVQLVAETEHILSHCLSEYVNYNTPKEKDLFAINLIRLSDILMRRLGDEYITCLATLAIERKEYYKAIDMLSTKRGAIKKSLKGRLPQPYSYWDTLEMCFSAQFSEHDGKEALKKDVEQIALIDFYIWYFSVLAGKTDYGVVKEEFHRYCKISQDLNAKSYYSVINLKELLINGFTTLSGGRDPIDSEKSLEIIKGIRQGFDLLLHSEPNQNIHFSIIREWDFLRIAYHVFSLYITLLKSPRNYDFRFYELAKKQFNSNINPDIVVKNSRIRKEIVFYRAISNTGSFIFKGDIKILKKNGKDCFGGFSLCPNTRMPSENKKQKWYRDVSNILVSVNDDNRDKCINFIQDVISIDNRRRPEVQHTIYVDYSGLENGEQFREDIQRRTSNNIHIRYFDDQMQAFVLCALFTRIENVLHTLYKPLNSYMISPIENDITYEKQQDKKRTQVLLKKSDIDGLSNWDVEKGEWILNACLPSKDRISFNGKVLFLEPFERSIPNLISVVKHLFCFSASARDDDDIVIKTNHFDIGFHHALNATEIYSDNIEIIDKKQDLRQALSSICQDATESQHFNHSGCIHDNCITLLTGAKLEQYPALREYLFSYLGVQLDNYSYILLQERASSSNVYYSLCVLDEKASNVIDSNRELAIQTICHSLEKNGIEKEGGCIKEIEKTKSTSEAETLQSLRRQIRPIDKSNPYVFISYRGSNGLRRLCEPVYRDVIYLQKEHQEVGFYLDIANMGDSPNKEIDEVITDDNCVGAIVYLSPDYITPYKNDQLVPPNEDACFDEAKLIYQQKTVTKCGHPFFVFFVFPSSVLKETRYDASLDAKNFVKEALINLQRDSDATRIKLYRDLFECEDGLVSPTCTILTWERFGIHFERNVKGRGDNFQNIMRYFIDKRTEQTIQTEKR